MNIYICESSRCWRFRILILKLVWKNRNESQEENLLEQDSRWVKGFAITTKRGELRELYESLVKKEMFSSRRIVCAMHGNGISIFRTIESITRSNKVIFKNSFDLKIQMLREGFRWSLRDHEYLVGSQDTLLDRVVAS